MPYATLKVKPRQRDFIREWLRNGNNGRQAAIHAGYAKGSAGQQASKMLKLPHIKAEIIAYQDRLQSREELRASIDREWLIWHAKTVVERCMSYEHGSFNATGAIKGIELLGKMEGLLDTRDAKGQRSLQIEIKNYVTEHGTGRTIAVGEGDARIEVSAGEILPPEPKTLGKPPIPEDMGEVVDAVTIELPDDAEW